MIIYHLVFYQKVIYKLGDPSSSEALGRHGVTVVCSVAHKDAGKLGGRAGVVASSRVVGRQEAHHPQVRGDNGQGSEVGHSKRLS